MRAEEEEEDGKRRGSRSSSRGGAASKRGKGSTVPLPANPFQQLSTATVQNRNLRTLTSKLVANPKTINPNTEQTSHPNSKDQVKEERTGSYFRGTFLGSHNRDYSVWGIYIRVPCTSDLAVSFAVVGDSRPRCLHALTPWPKTSKQGLGSRKALQGAAIVMMLAS